MQSGRRGHSLPPLCDPRRAHHSRCRLRYFLISQTKVRRDLSAHLRAGAGGRDTDKEVERLAYARGARRGGTIKTCFSSSSHSRQESSRYSPHAYCRSSPSSWAVRLRRGADGAPTLLLPRSLFPSSPSHSFSRPLPHLSAFPKSFGATSRAASSSRSDRLFFFRNSGWRFRASIFSTRSQTSFSEPDTNAADFGATS